jgi:hypothetical protein
MKKLIYFVALLLICTKVYASNQTVVNFQGSVGAVNEVSASNINLSIDLSTAGTDIVICDLTASNNNPNGFSLTFVSTNGAQLRSSVYSVLKSGTYLPYMVSIIEDVLPDTARCTDSKTNINLGLSNLVLNYNQTVNTATVGAKWVIKISYLYKPLFRGTYTDTLTVTIADL